MWIKGGGEYVKNVHDRRSASEGRRECVRSEECA